MALAIVLAGGGTGGHIFPALALAEAIRKAEPDAQVRFVGTARGLETKYVPAAGYPLDLVPSAQVTGRGLLRGLGGMLTALRGIGVARAQLRARRADLVIGVGGYASVGAVAAALTLGIPTVLLEPNALPGRANRLLGRFARRVFVSFEDAMPYFPAGRAVLTGRPVRALPRAGARANDGVTRLVITGGSQGARSVNRAIAAALPRLAQIPGLAIAHQTGARDFEETQAAYASAGVRAEVAAFFDDMPERIAHADLVVARSGGTVAEICAAGVASVLVPYPFAADDHQMANARELERAGACAVVSDDQAQLRLGSLVVELLRDPAKRARMAEAALRRARPHAARDIWANCAELLRERGTRK
ncbi:MAG TPA: undecaprenyldiphospho-muramoylpentapeptide beta-N-acetylglucosaminyltransferase [Myxococcota bacterium]|nr:undecaprenyldiphospho-muramoylpentapeptide beta-N-acetylglucosaminyltransferase [Myxococcota bacterium]